MTSSSPSTNGLKRKALAQTIDFSLTHVSQWSDRNVSRVLGWLERIAPTPWDKDLIHNIQHSWVTNDSYGQLYRRLVSDINPQSRRSLISNMLINNAWGPTRAKRAAFEAQAGFEPPFTYLISPSMRCNLHCVGCYAGEYTIQDDLPLEVVDRVINEGKDIGIYFVTVLGGEPFVRKDMWQIYEKHPDVLFMIFTSGVPLTQANVDRIARLGNIMPVISVEGSEAETDARRGLGVYRSVMTAFDRLREAGILFGFSAMATRYNVETLCSDAFNQLMVDKGCLFGWHFLYMPIGRDPDLNLMPTPQQREYLRIHGASRIRETLPLLVMDFWNDAPYVGGCIAGGRKYFHINNKGDVEPCIFVHFATDNVHDKSLSECLQSDFFKAIRVRQPYNPNLLLPCMLIDNPQVFRDICAQCHPKATHVGAEALVTDLAPGLNTYARDVQALMGEAWEKDWANKENVAV